MTYLYFAVIRVTYLSPCALFPISSLSWVHGCCISFLSLSSDSIFSFRSFWTPGANVPRDTRASLCSQRAFISFESHDAPRARVSRDTRISFCSRLTNFAFLPLLPFISFGAPWSNFSWHSYSALWSPLSDTALLAFEAISTRAPGAPGIPGMPGIPGIPEWRSYNRNKIKANHQHIHHCSSKQSIAAIINIELNVCISCIPPSEQF